jgi:hypothetical protein
MMVMVMVVVVVVVVVVEEAAAIRTPLQVYKHVSAANSHSQVTTKALRENYLQINKKNCIKNKVSYFRTVKFSHVLLPKHLQLTLKMYIIYCIKNKKYAPLACVQYICNPS